MELLCFAGTDMAGVFETSRPQALTAGNPAMWFDSFPSWQSDAGVVVSPDSAKTYSSVWQALQIISGDVARIALNLYYRDPRSDDRTKRSDQPAWALLNRAASPWMTAYSLRETLQQHALLQGNGYAYIERSTTNTPLGLYLLDPSEVKIVSTDEGLRYRTRQFDLGDVEPMNVLHLKGLGDDGISGKSVVTLARTSWGLGLAAEKHGAATMKNGAGPKIVLTHPQRLDKQTADTLLDQFEARHSGSANAGRPALAAGGLGITSLPISNEDAQWLQSRQFQRQEVASWFCLPPHKLGDSTRVGYNSVEAEERSYVSQTLMRWFARWQSECDAKLLTEAEKRTGAYWEHNVDALIQGDFATQAGMLVSLRAAKIITQNESRRKLNMSAVEGGDTFENPATSTATSASASIDREPLRALLADRAEQFIRSECSQLLNAAKAKQVAKAVETLYDALEGKLVAALSPTILVLRAAGIECPDAAAIAKRHCDESRRVVVDRLANSGTPAELLRDELSALTEQWPRERSAAIVALCFGDEK